MVNILYYFLISTSQQPRAVSITITDEETDTTEVIYLFRVTQVVSGMIRIQTQAMCCLHLGLLSHLSCQNIPYSPGRRQNEWELGQQL